MVDDQFERDLRAALRGRDPGGAPAPLYERISWVRNPKPPTTRDLARGFLSRLGAAAALVVIVVAIGAVVLVSRSSGIPSGREPAVGASPGAVAFDPTVEGAGVYTGPVGVELSAILIIATATGLLAIALSRRKLVRNVVGVVSVAVVLAAVGIAVYPGVESRGIAWYPGLGAAPPEPSSGDDERRHQLFVVQPDGILTFGFDVHNPGPVPITILGIAPEPRDMAWGRFTAAGLMGGPEVSTDDPRPLAPVTIEPDGYQLMIVAGRANRCALGRDNRGSEGGGAWAGIERLDIAYEMLGMRKVTTIQLPRAIQIPIEPGCQPFDDLSSVSP